MLDTGLRAAEFVSLRAGAVNRRSGLATVMGKGGKQRTIRVGSEARSAIARVLGLRGVVANGDPLWMCYDIRGAEQGPLSTHGLWMPSLAVFCLSRLTAICRRIARFCAALLARTRH
ncbi:MAG: tyrosine-type recombinase/integrase [Chloroflexi bacterium]|nr:tyrosine-type recombinase/integrase [Chloroflexota bacterium]